MPAPVPELKANKVIEEVSAIIVSASAYLSPDDVRIRRLLRETDASMQVDPAIAHCAKACVYQLTGNVAHAIQHIDNAIRLSGDLLFQVNRSTILSNLGMATEGQKSFNVVVQPKHGWTRNVWSNGYVIGAYRAMNDALIAARKLQIDLGGIDTATAERAATVMAMYGLSDEDIAPIFDVVGEILRRYRLFYLGAVPRTEVWDGEDCMPFVRVTFKTSASKETAHSMYLELVEEILQKSLKGHAAISVEFEGASAGNELKAA